MNARDEHKGERGPSYRSYFSAPIESVVLAPADILVKDIIESPCASRNGFDAAVPPHLFMSYLRRL